MEEARSVEELEATIRSLREENGRLKAELSRLRRNLDERPPHYL
jgi:regulator of replication initiation timing